MRTGPRTPQRPLPHMPASYRKLCLYATDSLHDVLQSSLKIKEVRSLLTRIILL